MEQNMNSEMGTGLILSPTSFRPFWRRCLASLRFSAPPRVGRKGFKGLGFRGLGFRGLRFRGLGFRVYYGLGSRREARLKSIVLIISHFIVVTRVLFIRE